MKTSFSQSFLGLKNTYLRQLLPQLIRRYEVVQLFYHPPTAGGQGHLVVHLESRYDAGLLQNQPWVGKLLRNHNTCAHFFYGTQLHNYYKHGHPFVLAYCRATALIYANEAPEDHLLINDTSLKKELKKLKIYTAQFYHDHDLLHSQIQPLVAADSAIAVLLQYERLLHYDLEYLEHLYMGSASRLSSLQERIASLIPFVPEIQQYFLKEKGNAYYLTALIRKAKAATLDIECYASSSYEAFRLAEAGVFALIEARLKVLQRNIKGKKAKPISTLRTTEQRKDKCLPKEAMAIFSTIKKLEDVYVFHHSIYGDTQTFYLLLIGRGMGTAFLNSLTARLKAVSGSSREFVLIGHSRQWIQKWLYYYQSFFCTVMQQKTPVYASSPYHAKPHWEVPYVAEYPDLDIAYIRTKKVFKQFLVLAKHPTDNFQGIANMFSLFFMSFCRTYIYEHLSYQPHYLSSFALWQLCLYATPDLRRFDYLFAQLDTPFFEFLDCHRMVQVVCEYRYEEKRKRLLQIGEALMGCL